MSDFIASLDPPLGIPKPNTLALVSFDLPIAKGDKIHCLDVLHSLTKYTLGFVDDGSEDFSRVSERVPNGEVVDFQPRLMIPNQVARANHSICLENRTNRQTQCYTAESSHFRAG